MNKDGKKPQCRYEKLETFNLKCEELEAQNIYCPCGCGKIVGFSGKRKEIRE